MHEKKGMITENLAIGYSSDMIKNISIKVLPGKVVTLIGPNGSGKSTLLKTLTGQLKLRSGVVMIDGEDADKLSASELAKRMSMVMTEAVRPELMTCREVAQTGRYPYTGRLGILSEGDKAKVEEALELTSGLEVAEKLFTEVSDGQRQRVMLARAICQEPEVLVLDEPVSFLDIKYKLDILKKIRLLADEKKMAVIMSIHEPEIAMRLSDTVVAIGGGTVKRIGTPAEVFTEEFIRDLYGIEDDDLSLLGSCPWFENGEDKAEAHLPEGDDKTVAFTPGVIMVQGTMSGVGKSLITAGLCRIFADDGYRVYPFKSQNMALNSYITDDGLEMGRAQVMQAECARVAPESDMNPVLLKPVSDCGSQVIVNGKVVGNMRAAEYFAYKKRLVPDIKSAFDRLKAKADIIVIEGAGSPAELNLKSDDIVNMGVAQMVGASVLLVGDIDRGGIFAQLIGTLKLLDADERERVKGLIVNRFRGDGKLFEDGIGILEEKGGVPVAGVVPYMDIRPDDEDSLSDRFLVRERRLFDLAVIRLPHISNYTDFDVFEQSADISVRYVSHPEDMGDPDMVVIPGTKNTIGDLRWLKSTGLAGKITEFAEGGRVIFGICGGYQMLGAKVSDPEDNECGGSEEGLKLLPVETVIKGDKVRKQYEGSLVRPTGVLAGLAGHKTGGYEIHMGDTSMLEPCDEFTSGKTGFCKGNVYGTYVHGVFDSFLMARHTVEAVALGNGKSIVLEGMTDHSDYKEKQYRLLAETLRESLDMNSIYRMIGISNKDERRYNTG